MSLRKQNIIVGLFLGIFSLVFLHKTILTSTKGRLSWGLADHYSLALGFLDNGFDFFHPETYSLNPEFTATKLNSPERFSSHPQNPTGITATDPPIHQYITALLMKLTGSNNYIIYRLYSLLFSLTGLFFLYKTSFLISKSFKFSFLLIVFVLTAPVFTNFCSSSLPSSFSCATLFISSYYYGLYYKTNKIKYFNIFILLITLAALNRFPFIIYLLGIFFTLILSSILKLKQTKTTLKITLTIIAISFVLGYFLYNKMYLSYHFGSILLSSPKPIGNIHETLEILKVILLQISWRYATIIHYVAVLILISTLYTSRIKLNQIKYQNPNTLFLIIVSIGIIMYSFLIFKQFEIHEYYILDTFLPILIFWSIAIFPKVNTKYTIYVKKHLWKILTLIIILNRLHFWGGYERIVDHPTSPFEKTSNNFEGSDQTLDSLHISRKAKILFLDPYTNLAFNGFKRKSFMVFKLNQKNIKRALNWDFDYIITQNFSFKENVLANYPNFKNETTIFFSNDKFTIHLKK